MTVVFSSKHSGVTVRNLAASWISLLVLLPALLWAEGAYLLGGGDTVNITVYEQPDLATEARIGPEGTIPFPLLGEVEIGGLTAESAAKRIAKLLEDRGFLKSPQVALTVQSYISQQVAILGQVGSPGNYSLEGDSNIVGMLAKAGGVTKEAADMIVVIRGDGDGGKQEVDMKRFYAGDMSQNVRIHKGDTILVPKMDTFYVYGEVKSPGMYRLERGMTVMQAVSVGGGITERGSLKGMKITRTSKDGKRDEIKVDLEDPLKSNDVLYVKERLF